MFASVHRLGAWLRLLLACFALFGATPAVATPVVDAIELRADAGSRRDEREPQRPTDRDMWVLLEPTPHVRAAPRIVTTPDAEPWRPWCARRLFIVQRALLV